MKKNILTLALLFMAFASFAQTSTEAKNILDKAYSDYEKSEGIQLSFKLTTSEANGSTHPSESGEAMVKGDKFRLKMEFIDTWFDGKTQWVLMKDANEVNISNPTGQEIAAVSPLALLGMYKNGYALKAPASKTVNGKSAHVIDMTPTAKNADFKTVSVAIDKKNNTILQVNITLKNGMKNKIDITQYNANYKFDDSEFVFNKGKYPGVEVIDLR